MIEVVVFEDGKVLINSTSFFLISEILSELKELGIETEVEFEGFCG